MELLKWRYGGITDGAITIDNLAMIGTAHKTSFETMFISTNFYNNKQCSVVADVAVTSLGPAVATSPMSTSMSTGSATS